MAFTLRSPAFDPYLHRHIPACALKAKVRASQECRPSTSPHTSYPGRPLSSHPHIVLRRPVQRRARHSCQTYAHTSGAHDVARGASIRPYIALGRHGIGGGSWTGHDGEGKAGHAGVARERSMCPYIALEWFAEDEGGRDGRGREMMVREGIPDRHVNAARTAIHDDDARQLSIRSYNAPPARGKTKGVSCTMRVSWVVSEIRAQGRETKAGELAEVDVYASTPPFARVRFIPTTPTEESSTTTSPSSHVLTTTPRTP
ncbi:hypothetical protein SCHPADRAFT_948397 [Schizopora paradoxa]|uniref:Uncharacterized protein n=1 Tax=Schizopora paradoxa TaxID=27342 RepID=A0A0H2QXR1_9AGAM|nr:hypothetical protein SCHPADRAFT_948397 [Schizopora paradoxa]